MGNSRISGSSYPTMIIIVVGNSSHAHVILEHLKEDITLRGGQS